VGSYTADGGAGLAVAEVDPATGALTVGLTVPGVPDASWLACSPDGRFLYTTNELDPSGTVTALERCEPRPMVLNSRPTKGSAPTHLCVHPSGRYLLTANYGSGSVAVLPLGADGRLRALTDLVEHVGGLAHQVIMDPSGRWVLAVDLGIDSVFVYDLDLDTGKLLEHQHLTVGTGPRHLVWHPDGVHVYLVCENASQVVVCTWDATTGTLTAGQIVGTVTRVAVTPNFPGEGVVSPDGRFLYVTNRGDNSIATFAINGDGLALLHTVSCGGDWPRHAILDPNGRRLYVSNQRSGTVTWLPRDPSSGLVHPVSGNTKATAVAMVLFT
jgi:6-phosphogluconolactonase (cycloisomerase 2 family)